VYPRLGILANVGLVAAGAFTKHITQVVAAGQEILGLQVRQDDGEDAVHHIPSYP
jgi:hypothetical protein